MDLEEAGSDGTPLDHGDSPATATPLAVGESIEGELSAGELLPVDIDYFRVAVSSAGRLIASTTGSTDTYGVIEDSSGNVLNENDDGGEGRNFRVLAAVEPGIYYIRVRGFDDSSAGAYTLTLQMEEGLDGIHVSETGELTPEIIGLYGTLVSTFTNIAFAATVSGTTSVSGEGGGSVEILGNDWTFQDYSPDGELIINGVLNVGLDQTPIPWTGEVTFSGSHDAELILDMEFSVDADGLSATGTITIDGAEFDVAKIAAAAAAAG